MSTVRKSYEFFVGFVKIILVKYLITKILIEFVFFLHCADVMQSHKVGSDTTECSLFIVGIL